jgi:surfactin synthase thioesterase subunit
MSDSRLPPSEANPWFLNGTPGGNAFLLFGFPYAGTGAVASYREWPERIGEGQLCPLQPPGRESRTADEPVEDFGEFVSRLADALSPYADRPYAFVGHCGAMPYMADTALALVRAGHAAPVRIFASSWGAPHKGLYGRLNFADLDTLDINAEIDTTAIARFGFTLPPDLREVVAEILMADLRLIRGYAYGGDPVLPCPVDVISWSADDVVPPETVWPSSWSECAEATHHVLAGDHWEFLRGRPALTDLIAERMAAAVIEE